MISKLTIGRLFNLGNYEHIRYEVTVELGPEDKPSAVLDTIESSLETIGNRDADSGLTAEEIEQRTARVKQLKAMTPLEFARECYEGFESSDAQKAEALKDEISKQSSALDSALEEAKRHEADRQQAFAALDAIHATVTSKTS